MYRFEWNQRKNEHNIRKHGVSFEEAVTVFYDEKAVMLDDPDHSKDEERFLLIGMSDAPRLLIVCHCYRKKRFDHQNHICKKNNEIRRK